VVTSRGSTVTPCKRWKLPRVASDSMSPQRWCRPLPQSAPMSAIVLRWRASALHVERPHEVPVRPRDGRSSRRTRVSASSGPLAVRIQHDGCGGHGCVDADLDDAQQVGNALDLVDSPSSMIRPFTRPLLRGWSNLTDCPTATRVPSARASLSQNLRVIQASPVAGACINSHATTLMTACVPTMTIWGGRAAHRGSSRRP
jgi:hypothetical protein